mmetsp:Transcript_19701/g.39036  ORF Transcript_19701/g.39036 Transcript_19701/m.39036 type:complete len:150 (-) Transcript_19701:15-464(-)
MQALAKGDVTMNNHHAGITPGHFNSNSQLTGFFNLLATSTDRKGVEFVSSIEGVQQPIYGTQYHPEKTPFEWATLPDGRFYEAINHSAPSVLLTSELAAFFIAEARKNSHAFASPAEEASSLIYNYPVTHTGPGTAFKSSFIQCYFFDF